MEITKDDIKQAEGRTAELRAAGYAESARYDRRTGRIVLSLSNGIELRIPAERVEGLAGASSANRAAIEISPAGLDLYWPKLDVDLYVPALMQGVLGSKSWTPAEMGRRGGATKSAAKSAASQLNGRKGGRPKKKQAA